MSLLKPLGEFLQAFELRSTGKWFILSAMIGVIAGVGAIVFQLLTHLVLVGTLIPLAGFTPGEAAGEHAYLFEDFEKKELQSEQEADTNAAAATRPRPRSPWLIVVVMAGGGLVSGWLVYTFAPEAEGHGTDAAIEAFHNKRGMIRARVPIIKTLASAVTLGTGGSGGREGPIAQIGAGFGSYLATLLNLSARDRRVLLAAGMGAGVGAIFRAPLAGALFAGEILYRDADIESDVIVPAAISSIIGYCVYSLSLPAGKKFEPLFGRGLDYAPGSLLELVPYALLAIVLVLVSIAYIQVFYTTHRLCKKVPIKPYFRPALGAAAAGLVALAVYYSMNRDPRTLAVLATGYGSLQEALTRPQDLGVGLLLTIAAVKIVTTSLTISSGGSGGVFGPSMVIGGCLGGAVGLIFQSSIEQFFPGVQIEPAAFAIIGMAGFFAGCAHAPISTIIMVSEMTGNYHLLLPSMWVSTLCFLLCRRWSLYTRQVPSRLESQAHRGDFLVDILEGIKVEEVYQRKRKIRFIPESMSLDEIVHALATTNQHYFPVVDAEDRVVGVFSSDDVRSYLYDETIWHLANARDIMVTNIVSVTPGDDLNTALQRFTSLNLDELPVFDPADAGRMLGVLRRKETIAFYNQRLLEHKAAAAE